MTEVVGTEPGATYRPVVAPMVPTLLDVVQDAAAVLVAAVNAEHTSQVTELH